LLRNNNPKSLDLDWNIAVAPSAEYDSLFAEVRRAYALIGNASATQKPREYARHL
jgi:hypothetical protein